MNNKFISLITKMYAFKSTQYSTSNQNSCGSISASSGATALASGLLALVLQLKYVLLVLTGNLRFQFTIVN